MNHSFIVNHDLIKLRPLTSDDIEIVRNWRNQESIRQGFIDQSTIEPWQQEKWFVKYTNDDCDLMFIIEYFNHTQYKPVGTVALYKINRTNNSCEFGRLMIGERVAKGLGRVATAVIVEFAIRQLSMESISLQVLKNNSRAIKIYEDVGFEIYGESVSNGIALYNMVYRKPKLGEK